MSILYLGEKVIFRTVLGLLRLFSTFYTTLNRLNFSAIPSTTQNATITQTVERKIITVQKMWIYSDGFDFGASGKEDNFHTHQKRIMLYDKTFIKVCMNKKKNFCSQIQLFSIHCIFRNS